MLRAYGSRAEELFAFQRGVANARQGVDKSDDYADEPELLTAYRNGRAMPV